MTAIYKTLKALDQAFLTALLLTGSAERAEAAVLDGIAALDFDGESMEMLVLETVKASIQTRAEGREQIDQTLPILPPELRRILFLLPRLRQCFVMRILVGVTPEVCSEILNLEVNIVVESTLIALEELPFIEKSRSEGRGSIGGVRRKGRPCQRSA